MIHGLTAKRILLIALGFAIFIGVLVYLGTSEQRSNSFEDGRIEAIEQIEINAVLGPQCLPLTTRNFGEEFNQGAYSVLINEWADGWAVVDGEGIPLDQLSEYQITEADAFCEVEQTARQYSPPGMLNTYP